MLAFAGRAVALEQRTPKVSPRLIIATVDLSRGVDTIDVPARVLAVQVLSSAYFVLRAGIANGLGQRMAWRLVAL